MTVNERAKAMTTLSHYEGKQRLEPLVFPRCPIDGLKLEAVRVKNKFVWLSCGTHTFALSLDSQVIEER